MNPDREAMLRAARTAQMSVLAIESLRAGLPSLSAHLLGSAYVLLGIAEVCTAKCRSGWDCEITGWSDDYQGNRITVDGRGDTLIESLDRALGSLAEVRAARAQQLTASAEETDD